MNITCPECSTSFDVPRMMLGADGRRVRCNHCGHTWLQTADEPEASGAAPAEDGIPSVVMPPEEEGAQQAEEVESFGRFAADDLRVEPIPQSLHPDLDVHTSSVVDPEKISFLNMDQLFRMVGAYMCGVALVVASVMALHYTTSPVLAFQDVDARISGDVTVVSGKIINQSKDERVVPPVEITPVSVDGLSAEGMRINPAKEPLKVGESVDFRAELQGASEAGGTMQLEFVL